MPITENATTITINGVTAVEFDRNYPYFNIRNDGNDTIYVSTSKADCPKDADGVVSVPPGGSYVAFNSKIGNVFLYLNGSGKASVIGKYDGSNSFKAAQGGSDESDYLNLSNKPSINGTTLVGEKNSQDLGIPSKTSELDNDSGYVTSDGDMKFSVVDGILTVTYDDGGSV